VVLSALPTSRLIADSDMVGVCAISWGNSRDYLLVVVGYYNLVMVVYDEPFNL
jgi:hypothetical protein